MGGPGQVPVAVERGTGTSVVLGEIGQVVVPDSCLLELRSVCAFSKPKMCLRLLCRSW